MKEEMLIKYVRKNGAKSHPVGVVVALSATQIGWSLCHKDDKWDKDMAKYIAINRARGHRPKNVPQTVKNAMDAMKLRAEKYFG